jgi:hypothetical protein
MDKKKLVKLSNLVGVVAIILLIYWVFVFISITVFGLKVFRENMTETFYLSVFGIIALMFGALIINIMLNLTRIAEKHNQDNELKTPSKKAGLIFLLSFPLIFGFLFGGDYLTTQKKEKMLISSAKSIIASNLEKTRNLVNYSFDEKWIIKTRDILELFSKTDTYFPNVSIIVMDTIDNSKVFLGFNDYYHGNLSDTIQPKKQDFLRETTKEERDYLFKVFEDNFNEVRFSARKGNYELFYPKTQNGKTIVLYFSDYQRYGKIGS